MKTKFVRGELICDKSDACHAVMERLGAVVSLLEEAGDGQFADALNELQNAFIFGTPELRTDIHAYITPRGRAAHMTVNALTIAMTGDE